MLEAGVVGDIAGESERTAPQGLHRGSSGAHQFRATAGGDHVRSRLGESLGESQPDAAGSADYDGGLVLEFKKRMTHGRSPMRHFQRRSVNPQPRRII